MPRKKKIDCVTEKLAVPEKKAKTSKSSNQKATNIKAKSTKTKSPKAPSAAANNDQCDIKLKTSLKETSWLTVLEEEFEKDYFKAIESTLSGLRKKKVVVHPPLNLIFNAFNLTPLEEVKVVILGQDPYHDEGQAHGLSFSVPRGQKIPPSLKNIYKELVRDLPGFSKPDHGCLEDWAKQGVLLLNATMTVIEHEPNSHGGKKFGWHKFSDHVIKMVSENQSGVVFILWGNFAHQKAALVDAKKHCVIKTAHPSPLSFNKFSGCGCFSETNQALKKFGKKAIDWSI